MIENWLLFAGSALLLAVSPGPDNIFVLSQSVARGARYGIAIASGLITGCIVHTSLVAFGFAVLIKDSPWLLLGIKIAGAAYLLYLAYKIYRSDSSIELSQQKNNEQGVWALYRIGITMNLLNPKVTLFFLALLPQFVIGESRIPEWLQIYILGGIFMLVSLLTFYSIALLAGKAATFIKSSTWFAPSMKWLQILVFIGIAIAIIIP
ncbi:LysE family translocator [Nonlabens xiamenensis]|uniref:LysE family translocator n=1 Tax=Nonlabens xiamenensis TaxID=2341043 RepID=UPI000F60872A|nr:LysE family translocator [Nonlabens xiamenensis]